MNLSGNKGLIMGSFFNKSDLAGNKKYHWLYEKLDDNFDIDDNGSQIIFGFNGIGKTSLFNCLKERHKDDSYFINYEDYRIANQKQTKISIGLNIKEIDNLKEGIKGIYAGIDIKKRLKDLFGIRKGDDVKKINAKLFRAFKTNDIDKILVSSDEFLKFSKDISPDELKILAVGYQYIKRAQSLSKEIEDKRNNDLLCAFKSVNEILSKGTNVCPICGSELSFNLKDSINKKIKELSYEKSKLVSLLEEGKITYKEGSLEKIFDTYKLICKQADKDSIIDSLLICNGSKKELDNLTELSLDKINKTRQMKALIKENDEAYKRICLEKEALKEKLEKYGGVNRKGIKFSNVKRTIDIDLGRPLDTYSSGQVDLICFIHGVYSFKASDKKYLIIDDPSSSYDLVHHYEIAYEIVSTSNKEKNVVVLTHSGDLVNCVNSQYPKEFSFSYLEEFGGKIYIKKFNREPCGSFVNPISIELLKDYPLISVLIRKESDEKSFAGCLHYSEAPCCCNGVVNLSLIKNIDLFSESFFDVKDGFYETTYKKIETLCSLRVWIEKELYNLITKKYNDLRKDFLEKNTIGKKIDFFFGKCKQVRKPKTLTREAIMESKVMLNQAVHYNSQILPFIYAMNLSIDMVIEEVHYFKMLFNNEAHI